MSSVETPSGKGAGDENFPVGSWLIRADLRPHVAAYYRFARNADDVGDNPDLAPEDKVARLDAMGAVLRGEAATELSPSAAGLRTTLLATGIDPSVGLDLLVAFKRDAVKLRTTDWEDLIEYCRYSANPVGRFLLHLHRESEATLPASDALCTALQIINHLQDCVADRASLDRVYLPLDMMAEAGASIDELSLAAATPALRRVFDAILDRTESLLATARRLPGLIVDRRMRLEAGVIVALADRLARELRRRDPVAERVALSKTQMAALAFGVMPGLWFRAA